MSIANIYGMHKQRKADEKYRLQLERDIKKIFEKHQKTQIKLPSYIIATQNPKKKFMNKIKRFLNKIFNRKTKTFCLRFFKCKWVKKIFWDNKFNRCFTLNSVLLILFIIFWRPIAPVEYCMEIIALLLNWFLIVKG